MAEKCYPIEDSLYDILCEAMGVSKGAEFIRPNITFVRINARTKFINEMKKMGHHENSVGMIEALKAYDVSQN